MGKIKKFFVDAFNDMKKSAKAQHEVDKANFAAVKAESRANFEENRFANSLQRAKDGAKQSWDYAHLSPSEKQALRQQKQEAEIEKAKERKLEAEQRIAAAKKVREDAMRAKQEKLKEETQNEDNN